MQILSVYQTHYALRILLLLLRSSFMVRSFVIHLLLKQATSRFPLLHGKWMLIWTSTTHQGRTAVERLFERFGRLNAFDIRTAETDSSFATR